MTKNYHYNARPRYTAGSPAAVDQATAEKLAADEIRMHQIALTGVWGDKQQAFAKQAGVGPFDAGDGRGLRSPAEYVEEHSNHWLVKCLTTGKVFVRPFHDAKPSRVSCKRCMHARELASIKA